MGQTLALRLTQERDAQAAQRCRPQALRRHGVPEKLPSDGSAAQEAAINVAQSNIAAQQALIRVLRQQKAYQSLGYKTGDFPVAERVAPEIVSLPMFPQLSFEQARQVAGEVLQLAGTRQAAEVTAG